MKADIEDLAKTLHDAGWTSNSLNRMIWSCGDSPRILNEICKELAKLERPPKSVWEDSKHWKLTDSNGKFVMAGIHNTGKIYLMTPGIHGFYLLLTASEVEEVIDALTKLKDRMVMCP